MALGFWILLSQVKAVSFDQLDRRPAFLSDEFGIKEVKAAFRSDLVFSQRSFVHRFA